MQMVQLQKISYTILQNHDGINFYMCWRMFYNSSSLGPMPSF